MAHFDTTKVKRFLNSTVRREETLYKWYGWKEVIRRNINRHSLDPKLNNLKGAVTAECPAIRMNAILGAERGSESSI